MYFIIYTMLMCVYCMHMIVSVAAGFIVGFITDQHPAGQGERGSEAAVKGWEERVRTQVIIIMGIIII